MNETNLMCSVSTKGDYIAIFAKLPSDFEKECANCIVFYDLLKLSLGEDYVEPLRTQYTDVLTFGGNIAVKKKKSHVRHGQNKKINIITVTMT